LQSGFASRLRTLGQSAPMLTGMNGELCRRC